MVERFVIYLVCFLHFRCKGLLCSLEQTDQFLLHFEQFKSKPAHYTVPEIVREGMPVFYLPPDDSDNPILSSGDLETYSDFANFWRPLCVMDINLWHKWLHVHRLSKPIKLALNSRKICGTPELYPARLVLCGHRSFKDISVDSVVCYRDIATFFVLVFDSSDFKVFSWNMTDLWFPTSSAPVEWLPCGAVWR